MAIDKKMKVRSMYVCTDCGQQFEVIRAAILDVNNCPLCGHWEIQYVKVKKIGPSNEHS